ncbi:MAG: hemerythrin domain-containing protein [Nitrospira sp.]
MPRPTQNATPSTQSNRKSSPPDAIQLLTQDHRKVELLFKEMAGADPTRISQVAKNIFKELEIHAALEEEIFYPALRSEGDVDELGSIQQGDTEINGAPLVDQDEIRDEGQDEEEEAAEETADEVINIAYEDHQAVKALIGTLKTLDSTDPGFTAGMEELKDLVMEHVVEEEDLLFPEAKLNLNTQTLGQQMQERKQALMSSVSL